MGRMIGDIAIESAMMKLPPRSFARPLHDALWPFFRVMQSEAYGVSALCGPRNRDWTLAFRAIK